LSEDHFSGEVPSRERIMTAHSAMNVEWLKRDDPDAEHFVYKQGHDEQCYICVLWNAAREAEEALKEIAEMHTDGRLDEAHCFLKARRAAMEALDKLGVEYTDNTFGGKSKPNG